MNADPAHRPALSDAPGSFADIAGRLYPCRAGKHQADIVYAPHAETRLSVVRPPTPGPHPSMLLFHGGGWVKGAPDRNIALIAPLVLAGWATVSVQYRLASTAPAPAALEDAVAALNWCRSQAIDQGFDSDRLVLLGVSAGGHLALSAGLSAIGRGRPAAIVNFYGIADVEALAFGSAPPPFVLEWLGQPLNDKRALARALSPIHQISGASPPVITVHGDADPLVPFAQSVGLHEALEAAGVVNRLIRLEGGGHGRFTVAQTVLAFAQIEAFLRALGLWPPLEPTTEDI